MPHFIEQGFAPLPCPTVASVGAFDGIHRGHQMIINRLESEARRNGWKSVLFTFDPHPKAVLTPGTEWKLLTVKSEKKQLLLNTGLDYVIFYPFTRRFAAMTGEAFLRFLQQNLNVRKLLLGYDHVFGSDRLHDDMLISRIARHHGIETERLPVVKWNGITVSTTEIKKRIRQRDIPTANLLLGYPYLIKGKVVRGEGVGRRLGFPTANLKTSPLKFLPPDGVYAVRVQLEKTAYPGVMNIGKRPTVDGKKRAVEVHILDFSGNLYQRVIDIHVIDFLRREKMFESLDLLRRQIQTDIEQTRKILNPP